jgi:hypothetical protein
MYASAARDIGRMVKRRMGPPEYEKPPYPLPLEKDGLNLLEKLYNEFENLASDKSFRDTRRQLGFEERYRDAREAAISELIAKYQLNDIDDDDETNAFRKFIDEMEIRNRKAFSYESDIWMAIRGGPGPRQEYVPYPVSYPSKIAYQLYKPKFDNQVKILQALKTTPAADAIRHHVGEFLKENEKNALTLSMGSATVRNENGKRQREGGKTKKNKKRRSLKRFK